MKNSIKTYSTHNQLRNFIFQPIITLFGGSIPLTFTDNDKFDSMNVMEHFGHKQFFFSFI